MVSKSFHVFVLLHFSHVIHKDGFTVFSKGELLQLHGSFALLSLHKEPSFGAREANTTIVGR